MGGAFWAGLAAGADSLAGGVDMLAKENKEKAALKERRAFEAGLLADTRAREDKFRAEDTAYRVEQDKIKAGQRDVENSRWERTYNRQVTQDKAMRDKADKLYEHTLSREASQDVRAANKHILDLAKEHSKMTIAADKLKNEQEFGTFKKLMDKDYMEMSPGEKFTYKKMFKKFTSYDISEAKKKGIVQGLKDTWNSIFGTEPAKQSAGVGAVLGAGNTPSAGGTNTVVDLAGSDGDNMRVQNPVKKGDFINARLTYAQNSGGSLDAFETTKSAEWLKRPANVKKMDRQRVAAAKILGKDASDVTNEDIFKLGDKGTDAMRNAVSSGQTSIPSNEGPTLRFDASVGLLNDKDKSGGGRPLITARNKQGGNVADILNTQATNSSFNSKYNASAKARLSKITEGGSSGGSVPTPKNLKNAAEAVSPEQVKAVENVSKELTPHERSLAFEIIASATKPDGWFTNLVDNIKKLSADADRIKAERIARYKGQ